jgi:hypothetical protein
MGDIIVGGLLHIGRWLPIKDQQMKKPVSFGGNIFSAIGYVDADTQAVGRL